MAHRPFPSSESPMCDADSIQPSSFQPPCRLHGKRGHCHLWLLKQNQSATFVCGGDWPLGLISLLCVVIFGVYYHAVMAPHVSCTVQVVGYVGVGLELLLLLTAAVKDPGLVTTALRVDSRESDRDYPPCSQCGAEGAAGTLHCPRCDVCVRQHDHHNFMLGGCVGAGNIWCLRAAYTMFVLLFFYLVLWGVYYEPLDT